MIFERANKTLALEFYANGRFSRRRYGSYVRGKYIDFSPEAINNLLKIVPLEHCDVKRRRDTCGNWDDEAWEELVLQMCVEGATWKGGMRMLLKSDFKPVSKAWESFLVQTLEGTSCSSEISLVRVHTIAAIMDGAPINVGELIAGLSGLLMVQLIFIFLFLFQHFGYVLLILCLNNFISFHKV
jgi:hypothetical protein